ncbi:hypothetical protein V1478_008212 [Vespula squamosa]|uniref:Uncharacterized protein n=1 Tax=Vespula squamosa TaxID=30214 RepID=A0ABD2AY43_VESSQ
MAARGILPALLFACNLYSARDRKANESVMSSDKIGDRVHGATATEKFEYEPLSAGHPLPSRLFSRKRFILAASEVAGYIGALQIAVGYTAWSGRVVKIKMMNARPSLAAALDSKRNVGRFRARSYAIVLVQRTKPLPLVTTEEGVVAIGPCNVGR